MNVINVSHINKTFKIRNKSRNLTDYMKNFFSKDWQKIHAVRDISLTIEEGEIVGYLGPNGAGKSTSIKMMTGVLTPDSGEINVNGYCPWKQRKEYVREIGAVFGQRSNLWWDLPARDSFELMKKLYKIPDTNYKANIELFHEILDLEDIIDKPVRQMSLGQRMRCEFVAAFLHDPKVVFLDEPTIGLDVVVKEQIRNVIKALNNEKKTTIILTTHDIYDVEELCKRIIIIDKGKKVFDDSIDQLKQLNGKMKYMKIEFTKPTKISIPGVNIIAEDKLSQTIEYCMDDMTFSSLISELEKFGEIVDVEAMNQPIEKIVKDIYSQKINL